MGQVGYSGFFFLSDPFVLQFQQITAHQIQNHFDTFLFSSSNKKYLYFSFSFSIKLLNLSLWNEWPNISLGPCYDW